MQVDWQVRQVWAQHPCPPLTVPRSLTPQFLPSVKWAGWFPHPLACTTHRLARSRPGTLALVPQTCLSPRTQNSLPTWPGPASWGPAFQVQLAATARSLRAYLLLLCDSLFSVFSALHCGFVRLSHLPCQSTDPQGQVRLSCSFCTCPASDIGHRVMWSLAARPLTGR